MFKRWLIASVCAGVILYIWGFIAYNAIPVYSSVMNHFDDRAEVEEVLAKHAPKSGMYVIRGGDYNAEMHSPDKPYVFMSYMKNGSAFYGAQPYIVGFFIDIIIGMFASLLMLKVCHLKTFGRIIYLTFMGFVVSFTIYVGFLNWAAFNPGFVVFEIVNWTISYFLMSFPIAFIMKRKECCSHNN